MSKFRVLINDNAHYMDESEHSADGVFANADEAIAACVLAGPQHGRAMMKVVEGGRDLLMSASGSIASF